MTPEALRALLSRPWRPRGRFALVEAEGVTAVAPVALAQAPRRLGEAVCATFPLDAGGGAGWRARLATAARQDLWRRLRAARGLAPVVVVAAAGEGTSLTLAACWLDRAHAAPGTLDALQQIFHDGGARSWTAWADRAKDRGGRGACSRRS